MWVIKILNSENKYEEHHYETIEKASEDYESFLSGIDNNDDCSILKLKLDTVIFPTDPKEFNWKENNMSPFDLFTNEEIENMSSREKPIKKELKEMATDNFDFKKMVKELGMNQIDSHEKRISKRAKEQAKELGNLKEEISNQVADILKDKE